LGNNWFRDLSPFCVQEFIRNDGFIAEDGNRYHYDFRVSWANGKIIGISARRSGFPLGSNSLKSFKTNLDTGGKMIGVFVGDRKEPLSYIDLTSGLEVDMGSLGLKKILDRKGLVMSYEMIERMEKMLTRASSAIEKESIKEGYIKPAYSELVLERVAKYGKELQ
jgi:hypothetical protein